MMMFKEIALNEALRIIGEGNKEKNLYFFSGKKFEDLRCYEGYNVVSSDIRNNFNPRTHEECDRISKPGLGT